MKNVERVWNSDPQNPALPGDGTEEPHLGGERAADGTPRVNEKSNQRKTVFLKRGDVYNRITPWR